MSNALALEPAERVENVKLNWNTDVPILDGET
jgi:hypothetical protein